jgi:hypothetical protein
MCADDPLDLLAGEDIAPLIGFADAERPVGHRGPFNEPMFVPAGSDRDEDFSIARWSCSVAGLNRRKPTTATNTLTGDFSMSS